MPRIESDREIRAAARPVGRVHGWVETLLEMCAHRRDHMPAGRKAEYSDLVRIDMPPRGVEAHQSHSSLSVLQRRPTILIWPGLHARHAILQQHAHDALGRQPVTGFGAFE